MMTDCLNILDNLNDFKAISGPLPTGSDLVDISGAKIEATDSGWHVLVKTVTPAQQNPRREVSVGLYVDHDGRMENNAAAGPRLGADTVYLATYRDGNWPVLKEVMNLNLGDFAPTPTKAALNLTTEGYVLDIPYAELPKDAKIIWRAGVGIRQGNDFTVDYVPDNGMSCAAALAAPSRYETAVIAFKNFKNSNLFDQLVAGGLAVVILVAAMVIWKKRKKQKV